MEYTKLRQANKIVCVLECATQTHIFISKRDIRKDRSTKGFKHQGKQQGRSILDLAVTLGKLFMEKQQEDLRSEISAGNGSRACWEGRS